MAENKYELGDGNFDGYDTYMHTQIHTYTHVHIVNTCMYTMQGREWMAENEYELGDGNVEEEEDEEFYLDLGHYADWNMAPSPVYVSVLCLCG